MRLVGSQHRRCQLRAVIEDDADVPSSFDDVIVGQDMPVAVDQEAGAAGPVGPDLHHRRTGLAIDVDERH